ncbi:MAG: PAS domain S-box protein, partial [Planctomycetes bacterium]|nr:PAS domain S-box protein [Planctomycetota bacterium]
MNTAVVLCNFIACIIFIACSYILLSRRKAAHLTPSEFLPLLLSVVFYAFVAFSNVLEHMEYTAFFDPAEDIAEVLFTLVFLFFVNNWRKQRTFEEVEEQRTWFRATLESIADGVITTDHTGKIRTMNKAMQEMTGVDRNEAIGASPEEVLSFINKENGLPVNYNPFFRILHNANASGSTGRYLLKSRAGKQIPMSDRTATIND